MTSIEELKRKKMQYSALLDKVVEIKKNIDYTLDNLEKGNDYYKKAYTIEAKLADNNILTNVQSNLSDISGKLEDIVSKISMEINKVNKAINAYYQEETLYATPPAPQPEKNDTNKVFKPKKSILGKEQRLMD